MARCSTAPAVFRRLIEAVYTTFVIACILVASSHAQDFTTLSNNAGISSMHTAITRYGTAVLLDRTDIGPSQILLANGFCRNDSRDLALTHDCWAHSVMLSPGNDANSTRLRPLTVLTDTWCSSGQFLPDGTLLQLGGDNDGLYKIRRLTPCSPDGACDWVEDNTQTLKDARWYSSSTLLPDGRVVTVGGRGVFTFEFIPRAAGEGSYTLQLLKDTKNFENDNYYPFVHLLPDDTLFVFANRDSVQLNYKNNTVLRKYPTIPGEPRNYPSGGSSVLLPLQFSDGFRSAEVMVCGGAQLGAFKNSSAQLGCSQTCGRMNLFDANASWAMETMPLRRCMGDMLLLPSRDVLIINGAQNGSQGWGFATNPAFNPVLYRPGFTSDTRFLLLSPTTIPRMYHSTASLLPDGRVLLAGSNTHQFYTYSGPFPTELRVESWAPPYLSSANSRKRPTIVSAPAALSFGQTFNVTFNCSVPPGSVEINLLSSPFTTHSFAQGQRLLRLGVASRTLLVPNLYQVTVTAPSSTAVAPPSYYMMFPVESGIAGPAIWVQMKPPGTT